MNVKVATPPIIGGIKRLESYTPDRFIGDACAHLMTRAPVQATAPGNELIFPLGFRPLLAGWNLLYLRSGPKADDPARGAEWNRDNNVVGVLFIL